ACAAENRKDDKDTKDDKDKKKKDARLRCPCCPYCPFNSHQARDGGALQPAVESGGAQFRETLLRGVEA
ncbi:MAG: hypothetical protein ACJ76J_26705, partial [Thermoanaerobaculia bacterium]